ncbi:Riboflavin biosynthesis protein RibF [Nocardioides aquaticus]|uniref:Riboflavin biosynthesis protein n=1 Tax=Nocardioides aquaticus TaxID=160826 RepID=A0ABX8EGT2_9ACTN|nr:bifunctional riboflavin kinase/FAD synthetase [Nocardioides aquaticus]QVT79085.1 Riboflavin biosynthesis protein RibF [Nocardioides aquaticus]
MWRTLDEIPDDLGPTAVTIGNFDGVHRGHRAVVARSRAVADREALPLVAVTFDPHPMAVLRPDHAPSVLTPVPWRAELLGAIGVDEVLALPFDRAMAAWTPEEFVRRVLVERLHARAVVVGANFRFGARAAGDTAALVDLGREQPADRRFTAEGVVLDGGPQVWSSTYVRTCLAAGDVAGATEALGRPPAVRGPVVQGDQRGRELGYPTANVEVGPDVAVAADGVYAGRMRVLGGPAGTSRPDDPAGFPVAVSVGTNPTFAGERSRRVEAYVIGRTDLSLYGAEVEVDLSHHLRGMAAFDSVDELLVQMSQDVEQARVLLGG